MQTIVGENAELTYTSFHRRMEGSDPLFMVLFYAFGAMVMLCTWSMSRMSNRFVEQEEQSERQEILETRRHQFRRAIQTQNLFQVLSASDFISQSAPGATEIKNEENVELGTEIDEIKLAGGRDEVTIDDSITCSETISDTTTEEKMELDFDLEHNTSMSFDDGEVQVRRWNTTYCIAIICPICLEHYKEGDTVVLSGNQSCTHGFHQQCILEYLVCCNDGILPCPCCRQDFLPMKP